MPKELLALGLSLQLRLLRQLELGWRLWWKLLLLRSQLAAGKLFPQPFYSPVLVART